MSDAVKAIPKSFTVELTDNGRNDLASIVSKLGVSVGEALSRAIGMEAFLLEQEDAGSEIILKGKNGNRRVPVRERGGTASCRSWYNRGAAVRVARDRCPQD